MAKDAEESTAAIQALLMAIDFLQLLGFALSAETFMPWHDSPVISHINELVGLFSLSNVSLLSSLLFKLVACYVSLLWVCSQLACAGWVGFNFISERFTVMWPVKVLRMTAILSTTVLFIPLMSHMTKVYSCEVTWLNTGWTCFNGPHFLLAALVALVSLVFAAFSLVVVSCFFDRDPRSSSLVARPHGRVEVSMIALKLFLTILFNIGPRIPTPLIVTAVALAGCANVYLYYTYLPYYNQTANRAQVAFGAVFAWAGLCSLFAVVRGGTKKGVEASLFLFGCVPVAFCAYNFARSRFESLDGPVQLKNAFMVELKVRRMLSTGDVGDGVEPGNAAEDRQLELFQRVESLYSEALDVFVSSTWLHVFVAQYIRVLRSNRHVELSHLTAAEGKQPPLDVEFLLFQRRRETRQQDDATGLGSMSVLTRIQFERFKSESDEYSLKAREKQVEFWAELLHKVPSLQKLDWIGRDMEACIRKADEGFANILKINPNSLNTLRQYAQFLLDVSNQKSKAEKLVQQADDVEDAMSKEHANVDSAVVLFQKGAILDASRDDVGVITIGQTAADLGIILSVNTIATKLFGYLKTELIGRNVSVLVPEPLATSHQSFMIRYVETGRETVMNTTRTVFGKHRQGYIFPMLLNVKPMETSFAGVMQPLPTQDHFIMFFSNSFVVSSATQESLGMMGVQPVDVDDGAVDLSKFIQKSTLNELLAVAQEAMDSGDGAPMRRRMVEVSNVSKVYLHSLHQGDGIGFSKKKLSKSSSSKLSVWVRLQIMRFTRSGKMTTDMDNKVVNEGGATVDGGPVYGDSSEFVEERLISMSWSHAKEGDVELEVDAPVSMGGCPFIGPAARKRTSVASPNPAIASVVSAANAAHTLAHHETEGARIRGNAVTTMTLTQSPSSTAGGSRRSVNAEDDSEGVGPDEGLGQPQAEPDKSAYSVADSSKSAGSASAMFHRVMERGRSVEEGSLKILRLVLMLVSATTVCFTLAMLLVSQSVVGESITSLQVLKAEAQRCPVQQNIVELVLELEASSAGLPMNQSFATLTTLLADEITTFTVLNYELSVTHPPSSALRDWAAFTEFPVQRLYDGEVTIANQTFGDLLASYTAAAHMVQQLPADQVQPMNIYVWQVINNNDVMYSALVQSYNMRNTAIVAANEVQDNVVDYIVIAALVVLVAEAASVVLPITFKIEKDKYKVFLIFMHVPVVVVRRLLQQAQTGFDNARLALDPNIGLEVDEDAEREQEQGDTSISWDKIDFSMSKPRRLGREYGWSTLLCLKFSVPIIICLAYFLGMYAYVGEIHTQMSQFQGAVLLSEERRAAAEQAQVFTLNALLSDSAVTAAAFAKNATSSLRTLLLLEEKLFLGMAGPMSSAEEALMLNDGCLGSASYAACANVSGGLFGMGLHAVIQQLSANTASLLAQRSMSTSTSAEERLADPAWVALNTLSSFVVASLETATVYRLDAAVTVQKGFNSLSNGVGACFIVLVVLAYVCMHAPMVAQLDSMLKRTRGMLLLFPDEVITGVSAVKDLFHDYAKSL